MDEPPFHLNIYQANVLDAGALSILRVAAERERYPERAETIGDEFAERCCAYFRAQLGARPTVVFAWLATVDTTVVGSAALTLATSLPRPMGGRDALDGRIRGVYVDPHARRRGIAIALVRAAIARARACGVSRLTLGASPDGKPLYEKLGFVRNDDEMVFASRG